MQLEYFYYFVRLVDSGSLSKAASSLYLSPQGLSKAMQKMNTELGVILFYRDKSGLHLTSAGHEVYEAAKEIVAANDKLNRRLTQYFQNDSSYETLVYSSSHMSIAFLHRALTTFLRKYPAVKVRLIEQPRWELRKIPQILQANEVRFVSVLEDQAANYLAELDESCSFYELGRADVMCRVSANSDLAAKSVITREDLKDRSIALFVDEVEAVETLFGPEIGSQVGIIVSNYSMLLDVISNDKNLVGITDSLIEQRLSAPHVCAIPLLPASRTIYGYVLSREQPPTESVTELLETVREMF